MYTKQTKILSGAQWLVPPLLLEWLSNQSTAGAHNTATSTQPSAPYFSNLIKFSQAKSASGQLWSQPQLLVASMSVPIKNTGSVSWGDPPSFLGTAQCL